MAQASSSNTNVFGNRNTSDDAFNAGPSSTNMASLSAGTALTANYLSVPSANPNPPIPFSYYNGPQPWGAQTYSSALPYTNAAPYRPNNQDGKVLCKEYLSAEETSANLPINFTYNFQSITGVHSEQLVPFTTDNHYYAAPALHLKNSTAPATYATFASTSSSYDNGPSNSQTPLTLSSGTPSSGYNHPSTNSGGRENGQSDVNSPRQTGTVPESPAMVSNPEPESQLPGHGPSKRRGALYSIDSQTGKFVCTFPDCGKQISRKDNVKGHWVTHSPNQLFACNYHAVRAVPAGKTFCTKKFKRIQRCRQLHPASLVEEPQAWLATFAFVHSSPSQPICLPLRQHHIISSISQPLRFQRPLTTVQSDYLRIALYDQPTKYRRTAVPSTSRDPDAPTSTLQGVFFSS
ncbi:hypothetical protein PtB15_2B202 [Puccinia triticina]|nr:hypothetical protein PtB15_2B202 [Puccinia triticina]